ncbi:MAG: T9SS type A sorting domain-containing protein [Bacteroidales bacterium]
MKKIFLLSFLIYTLNSYTQPITRGPNIGEIYFIGYTVTQGNHGIYRSIDFGETATCVDSTTQNSMGFAAIVADKSPGGLYLATTGQSLYYSENYGNQGSWIYKNSGIYPNLCSGRNEGEIFNSISSHSYDYGNNFITHSLNGFFGTSVKDVEIDFSDNICYCIAKQYNVIDTQFFFISYDSFENFEVQFIFNFSTLDFIDISRGNNEGEIYLLNKITEELLLSHDYGANWELKNQFTCPNLPVSGISGGRQSGELYLKVVYNQLMSQRRHVYIYHSLDYGETFNVYHPVSIGPDPIFANFIAEDTLVEPDDTVQFTDLSNDAETWEWDFDNDGTIDSYEQNPTYIYQDTGYYTVKLMITGYAGVIEDYGIRYNYIHVDDLTNTNLYERKKDEFFIWPNPMSDYLNISSNMNSDRIINICMYNSQGRQVRLINIERDALQNTISIPVTELKEGIYFLQINTEDKSQTKKIIITH